MRRSRRRPRPKPRTAQRRTSPLRALRVLSDWAAEHAAWELHSEFDTLVRATLARATKTYRAATLLISTGFGPQAAMLGRSVFEDMLVVYWMAYVQDEGWVVQRLEDQLQHGRLLLEAAVRTHDAIFGEDEELTLPDREELLADLDRYEALFGRHGETSWWSRDIELREPPNPQRPYRTVRSRTMDALVTELGNLPELQEHWRSFLGPNVDAEAARQRPTFLRVMFDLAQQYNNELLHHTGYALGQATDDGSWREDSSDEWVREVSLFLYWTYGQLLLLMCNRFDPTLKPRFETLFHSTATEAFHPSPST